MPMSLRISLLFLFAALSCNAESITVSESGEIACSTGTWRRTGANLSGSYVALWRKQRNGQWKVLLDSAWFAPKPEKIGRLQISRREIPPSPH
jgi:ketosteroid isomerase-like protein